jgi:hypothetical protein
MMSGINGSLTMGQLRKSLRLRAGVTPRFIVLLTVFSLLATLQDVFATAPEEQECRVMKDGSQVCKAINVDEKSSGGLPPQESDEETIAPSPADGIRGQGVGFGWREEKPFEELKKDPKWLETARKNNVIVDPEERQRMEAMFEDEDEDEAEKIRTVGVNGQAASGSNTNNNEPLYRGVIERTEERKALDRYEDGGSTVYSASECYDISESCGILLERDPSACGDVDVEPETANEKKMRFKCSVSCKMCMPTEENSPLNVPHSSIGPRQKNNGNPEERNKVNKILGDMISYLRDEVLVEQGYANMYELCYNRSEICAFWASIGECDSNAEWMQQQCSLACKSCDQHQYYGT